MVRIENIAIGDFTAKLGYKSWALEQYQGEKMEWWKQVWKSEGPFKARITIWLALKNNLLTWENIKTGARRVLAGVFNAT